MRFKIVVPSFNSPWIKKNLDTLASQTYRNFDVCVIDDASTMEGQKELIESYVRANGWRAIFNETNRGALANIVAGIDTLECDNEDVILIVDGDDHLYNERVLAYIESIYRDSDLLLTYGQQIFHHSGRVGDACHLRRKCIRKKMHRKLPWVFCQLRTFKYSLFRRIDDEDLRDEEGHYLRLASDVAIMYPMLEMAGRRIKNIDQILYVVNDRNQLSDKRLASDTQQIVVDFLRSKPTYEVIG